MKKWIVKPQEGGGSKWYFLNGFFSEWCVQRVARICKGRRHQHAWNTGVFGHCGALCRFLSQAEVSNLKNTLWKTPCGTLQFKNAAKSGLLGQNPLCIHSIIHSCHFVLSVHISGHWQKDAALLRTVGGFLLTVEPLYLPLCFLSFCLQLERFRLEWEEWV